MNNVKKNNKLIIEIIICSYPIALVLGTAISEFINISLILFFFLLTDLKYLKKIIANKFIKLLFFFWLYLLVNYLINYENASLLRSFGFVRYILLIISINFFYEKFKINLNFIFTFWFIIISFLILDLYLQLITGKNLLGLKSIWPGRLSGLMSDELKIFSLLLGFVFYSLLIFKNKSVKFNLFVFFIITLIFIFSNERSNTLKFIIGLVIFTNLIFFINFQKNKIFASLVTNVSIIVFMTIIIYNYQPLKQRFIIEPKFLINESSNFKNVLNNSTYGAHYLTAYKIFKDNILFGTGSKTFRIVCHNDQYIDNKLKFNTSRCSTHPHNFYLEFLSELGIFGTIFILSLFVYLLNLSIRFLLLERSLEVVPGIVILITTLLPLPSGSFFTSFNSTIFWINIAFMLTMINGKFNIAYTGKA